MKVLIVGKGGREHALVWKIAQSPRVHKIYAAPGNPGMSPLAECIDIRADLPAVQREKLAGEIERLAAFAAEERIDLTVVGPENALAGGVVDRFRARGLKIFGPTRAAARLETSKAFAKELMQRLGVPTARHRTFAHHAAAAAYVEAHPPPLVVKASGLAAGKGALVCSSTEEALAALRGIMDESLFGAAGSEVVIEEYMEGEEASLFAIADGRHFVTLASAQDHKRIFEGDKGPNTGGMGAYAPAPVMTPERVREAEERIIRPVLEEMQRLGCPFQGVLYCGLMITAQGLRVVEFNVRFGDPETQVVLPLLETDLVAVLQAACEGRLEHIRLQHAAGAAVCVVLACKGYPGSFETGGEISGLERLEEGTDLLAFHAGTLRREGRLRTAGGRVLSLTATAADLPAAVEKAYAGVERISFEGCYFRRDIAHRAWRRPGR